MEEAVKKDQGKDEFDALPWKAIAKVGRVMAFGKRKYSKGNYLQGEGLAYSRLTNACLRHLIAFEDREEFDPESGESHLAHAACCILMLHQSILMGKGIDDRMDIDGVYQKVKEGHPPVISVEPTEEQLSPEKLKKILNEGIVYVDNEPSPIAQLRQLAKEARQKSKSTESYCYIIMNESVNGIAVAKTMSSEAVFGAIYFPDAITAHKSIESIGKENLIQAFRKELGLE
jgi:hypothetical protein